MIFVAEEKVVPGVLGDTKVDLSFVDFFSYECGQVLHLASLRTSG